MSRAANPFDPFGCFTAGPMALFQIGIEIMQQWQRAMLPMLVLPTRSLSGVDLAKPWGFAGFMPQVDARVTPAAAAREAVRPAPPQPAVGGRLSLEAMVARKQGRENPWLGCLQGVQVVYPATPAVEQDADVDRPVLDAVVSKSRVAKVKAAATAKRAPVKKAAATKAPASEKKAATRRKPASAK